MFGRKQKLTLDMITREMVHLISGFADERQFECIGDVSAKYIKWVEVEDGPRLQSLDDFSERYLLAGAQLLAEELVKCNGTKTVNLVPHQASLFDLSKEFSMQRFNGISLLAIKEEPTCIKFGVGYV